VSTVLIVNQPSLIKPDMRFFRIRLSDVLHSKACEKKGADFFDTAASLASDLSPPSSAGDLLFAVFGC
jgi:hypothetical protein